MIFCICLYINEWHKISPYAMLKSKIIFFLNINKSTFFEEFGSLLATLGIDMVDRLITCGDLNLPGTSPDKIDDHLAELLNSTSFTQLVNSPTRHDSQHIRSSLLDLIITPSPSKLISTTSVVSLHEISDHDLAIADINETLQVSPENLPIPGLQKYQSGLISANYFIIFPFF